MLPIAEPDRERFAKTVAGYLEQGRLHRRYQRLRLAVEPKFLGMVREHLSEQTRQLISEEINEDLSTLIEFRWSPVRIQYGASGGGRYACRKHHYCGARSGRPVRARLRELPTDKIAMRRRHGTRLTRLSVCAGSKIQVACKTEGSDSGPTFASSLLDPMSVEHARPVVSSISCFTHASISRATRQISDVDLDVADAAIFDLRDEGGDLRLQ
jgi:hypothetical protein